MDSERLILDALNEIKSTVREMREEIKADINLHKKENETDVLRLYDMCGELRQKTTVLETKVMFWQWIAGAGAIAGITSIVSAIMRLII